MLKVFCNGCDNHILPQYLALEGKDYSSKDAPTPLTETFHLCTECMCIALNAIQKSLKP